MSAQPLAVTWRTVVQRLRREPRSLVAMATLGTFVLLVLVGPHLVAYAPYEQIDIRNLVHAPPSLAHLLGTDAYSRDVLSRVLSGGRVSLIVALSAVSLETILGVGWGMAAGLAGGRVDTAMMRCVDAGMSIPRVLLLLALLAAVPQIPVSLLVLVIGMTGWFGMARLVRAQVCALRDADFVVAARALGVTPARIAWTHLLPHVSGSVLVAATFAVGQVIVLEAGLSWLGVGIQPPDPSWGNIIGDGTEFLQVAPWVWLAPGTCLILTVVAVSAVGDGLRDALAPRQLPPT